MSHRATILCTVFGCLALVAIRCDRSSKRPAKTQAKQGEPRGASPRITPDGTREDFRAQLTRVKLAGIDNSLFLYALDKDGDLPKGRGEKILAALTGKQDLNEDGIFDDPWLADHKDGWGNPFLYEWPTKKWPNAKKPAVWSRGPNGVDEGGMGDDIRNWE